MSALLLFTGKVHPQDNLAAKASDLFRAGQYHQAELVWRQMLLHDPKNASLHSNLGVALAQQGDLPAAVVEYTTSLRLNSHQPEVAFNLGAAEFKQGHFSQSLRVFSDLAREKPGDERLELLLGMRHFGLRQ